MRKKCAIYIKASLGCSVSTKMFCFYPRNQTFNISVTCKFTVIIYNSHYCTIHCNILTVIRRDKITFIFPFYKTIQIKIAICKSVYHTCMTHIKTKKRLQNSQSNDQWSQECLRSVSDGRHFLTFGASLTSFLTVSVYLYRGCMTL